MPQTARRLSEQRPEQRNVEAFRADPVWAGELHGEVGAMHRAIQERLFDSVDLMAVVAVAARPGDALATKMSRLAGWAALGGGFAATLALLLTR